MITLDLFNKKLTESVAEGVDSEELANEVYAEFERIYPNLARRAGERTVHAAIMDVLNYGGDSDPSALAQDVARAVKQDLQGVAEGDSLGDTMAKLAQQKFPNALIRKDGETVQQAPQRKVSKPTPAPVDRAALAKQLKSLQAEFDPDYDRSDDHGYWTKHRGIAQRINSIKRQLSQDVKEATPSWADPKSADYVGRREAARRMSAQPAKPTTPPAPQWTSASKSQPSSIKYAAKKPAKQSTAKQAEPTDRLTPAEYIKRIGAPNLPEATTENKKKDNDDLGPQVKDVGLQRAIGRAKADFPTAGSGLEALAKDFMRSQDADQQALDQLRQAERKQDSMLSQIAKLDQEQEREIDDLEQQNSTLAQRLQKLQSVNSQLEKKLAAMSGRGEKRQADKAKPEPTSSASDPEEFAKAMGTVSENNKEQEVDYDDPRWDAMVQRVGQKAREQEKKKPVDIKDLARRLAAVKLKDEK